MDQKIKLFGYNNLTKSFRFNIYSVCYASNERYQRDYISYIDEKYNTTRLTQILVDVANMIQATILNISKQDYDPQGASVNLLIAESELPPENIDKSCNLGLSNSIHAHLDKSHMTVHTFPEYDPKSSIATFRVDIDVVTCGNITPLNALNYLIESFDSDIIVMDYKVRGFARSTDGKKFYIDHNKTSIQEYIDESILAKYITYDINLFEANIFHTKMMLKDIDINKHLYNTLGHEISPEDKAQIVKILRREMKEIYDGENL